MLLLAADYCQLELRILCELSRDKTLAQILNNSFNNLYFNGDNMSEVNIDFFKNTDDPFDKIAQYFNLYMLNKILLNINFFFLSINSESISNTNNGNNQTVKNSVDCDRKKAKQLCYAIIYGMGAEKLSQEMEISKLNAQNLINQFFELFPSIYLLFLFFFVL